MIEYINCNIRSLNINERICNPDVEIKWNTGFYALTQINDKIYAEGLQTDDYKYGEKMKLCRKIAEALFELKSLIDEENQNCNVETVEKDVEN